MRLHNTSENCTQIGKAVSEISKNKIYKNCCFVFIALLNFLKKFYSYFFHVQTVEFRMKKKNSYMWLNKNE